MQATNDFILATHMLGCKAMGTAIIATAIIMVTTNACIPIEENITIVKIINGVETKFITTIEDTIQIEKGITTMVDTKIVKEAGIRIMVEAKAGIQIMGKSNH
jgi:hypothetical protein